jgi:opacity protein-like surface antigen
LFKTKKEGASMKKILLTTLIFLLTASAGFSQEKNIYDGFIIGMEADYHDWNSNLNDYKINGVAVSGSEIDNYNNNYDFIFNFYSYNLMLGYDIFDDFQVFGMVGLATIRQETNDLNSNEGAPHDLFLTNDPGVKLSLEFVYTYSLTEKLSISAIPEFSYIKFYNMKLAENSNPTVHSDYSIHLGLIDWKAGLYANYDLGWIMPFVGAVYQDFIKSVEFDGHTVDSFNNKAFVERELKFNQDLVFAGSAGFKIKIDPYKYFTIKANVGNGFSVIGSVMFKL